MRKLVWISMFGLCCSAVWAHGGGCRKDSPPGQCCHIDRKAGTFHCH